METIKKESPPMIVPLPGHGYASYIFRNNDEFAKIPTARFTPLHHLYFQISKIDPDLSLEATRNSFYYLHETISDPNFHILSCLLFKILYEGRLSASKEEAEKFFSQFEDSKLPNENEILSIPNLYGLRENPFLVENGQYYLKKVFLTQHDLSSHLKCILKLSQNKSKPIQSSERIDLDAEQKKAIKKGLEGPLSIIGGGPGTGKTFLIREIIRNAIETISPASLLLLAPTGKAAKRLRESAFHGLPAGIPEPMTIHKYLATGIPVDKASKKILNEPIKVVIIDESSMVDFFLFHKLLNKLSVYFTPGFRLIMVGDPNQLPPVGSGSIFADLLEYGVDKKITVVLKKSHRTGLKNILNLSTDILEGRSDTATLYSPEIQFIDSSDPMKNGNVQRADTITDWILKKQSAGDSCQVIAPYRGGETGIFLLNKEIHSRIQNTPNWKGLTPMILNKNLYDLDIFNGETGFFRQLDAGNQEFLQADKEPKIIPESMIDFFEMSYAITIHKSQGSEYDHVCIVLPETEEKNKGLIMNCKLLYTAVTRAKKSITILGDKNIYTEIIQAPLAERSSNIAELL